MKRKGDSLRFKIINYIELVILILHKITQLYYYVGDLEGNDIRGPIAKCIIMLNEIYSYLKVHKPDTILSDKIELECTNYTMLCNMMGSIFSIFCIKKEESLQIIQYKN